MNIFAAILGVMLTAHTPQAPKPYWHTPYWQTTTHWGAYWNNPRHQLRQLTPRQLAPRQYQYQPYYRTYVPYYVPRIYYVPYYVPYVPRTPYWHYYYLR